MARDSGPPQAFPDVVLCYEGERGGVPSFAVDPEDGVRDIYKTVCIQGDVYMADLVPESLYRLRKPLRVLLRTRYVERPIWIAEVILRVDDKKFKPFSANYGFILKMWFL